MKKVILTKGLPASGKSTWAKQQLADNPAEYKRINKDDLREMLDGSKWSSSNEKFVVKVRDMLILQALEAGKNVIIDDTNLHPKHEEHIKQITKGLATVEIKDFTDVPIEKCIENDLKRANSVGEKVIRTMYRQFIQKAEPAPIIDPELSDVVLCDLDGTLALFGNANPYDRDFLKDKPNEPILNIINNLEPHIRLIIVSGRNGKYKEVTEKWLAENNILYDKLIMRQEEDMRKDSIIKQEIYENEIKGKYNVLFVLDDRNQVVELWRSLGLVCLQVADGDF